NASRDHHAVRSWRRRSRGLVQIGVDVMIQAAPPVLWRDLRLVQALINDHHVDGLPQERVTGQRIGSDCPSRVLPVAEYRRNADAWAPMIGNRAPGIQPGTEESISVGIQRRVAMAVDEIKE